MTASRSGLRGTGRRPGCRPTAGTGRDGDEEVRSGGDPAVARRKGDTEIRRAFDPAARRLELAEDARRGLTARPKALPPKWFYDARGSRLFERITALPEYYQTRTERAILERVAPEVVRRCRPEALVELGAGSAAKTRLLLTAMRREGELRSYAPVDVSGEALEETVRRVAEEYPGVRVVGVVADFESPLALPFADQRRLVAFLGSTIGNLEADAASAFLGRIARVLGAGEGLLVGFDLVKDPERLVRAYDDAAGVTAAFNRNVLRVLNRELDADFDPEAFAHRAVWNEREARIEMYLVAERALTVRLEALDLEVRFEQGEPLLTELSHKYTRASVERLLSGAGLALLRWSTDEEGLFALALAGLAAPGEVGERDRGQGG